MAMQSAFVIVAQNLAKTYPPRSGGPEVKAVQGITFTVPQGKCIGLLGPNGAGKTTTMRMLIGLTAPTAGELTVFGEKPFTISRATKKRIGLVPQEDNLDPDLSVEQNLFIYGRYFGIAHAVLATRVPELLAFMQLTEKAQARVMQLSGGMKRRLVIARALISDPDLIILDEPTTGLDPQARVMIWQKLVDLKKRGKTLLLTTHYMDEAQRLCDHIVLIDHGKVLDAGTPQELIARHVKGQVYEVHKPLPQSSLTQLMGVDQEDIGDSVLFYVNDGKQLTGALPENHTYLHRPANLEDVFLRLTGRVLRV
jgi:lipooligosaccharide transport system ATP-binding protein